MSYNNRSGEQVVDIVDVDIMDLTVEDIEQVVPCIRKTGTLLADAKQRITL